MQDVPFYLLLLLVENFADLNSKKSKNISFLPPDLHLIFTAHPKIEQSNTNGQHVEVVDSWFLRY